MKLSMILSFLFFGWLRIHAQTIVYDPGHFAIVNQNGAVRLAAENTQNNYLHTIHNRLDDISLNVSSVVMVQTLIHNALTQVNQALKSGLAVKQIGQVSNEIIMESTNMITIARTDPILLLFAEDVARQLKSRSLNLVSEVSGFILKEGDNVLMDFEKRDALLRKVILELRVMRALCYSMSRSMYWAKMNRVLKIANPYSDFINQDTRLVNDILYKSNLLKK